MPARYLAPQSGSETPSDTVIAFRPSSGGGRERPAGSPRRPTLVTPTLAVKLGRPFLCARSTAPSPPFDERARGQQLLPVALAQVVETLAVEVDVGARQRRHAGYRLRDGAVSQVIEPRRRRAALPVQLVLPIEHARKLRLQAEHRLLQSLAGGVAGPCDRLVVIEQRPLLAREAERGVDVPQVVERLLDLGDDVPAGGFVEVVQGRRLEQRHPATECQRAEPGEGLAQRHAVELRSDPGLDAAQRLGEAHHRIGQRGDLRDPLPGGPIARPGLEHAWVVLERRGHVLTQGRLAGVEVGSVFRLRRLSGGKRRKQTSRRQDRRRRTGCVIRS